MTKIVDTDEALALLNRAVAEKGADYQDPNSARTPESMYLTCDYADDNGAPLCIIGHVLHYLGVNLRPLTGEGEFASIVDIPVDREGEFTGMPGKLDGTDIEFTPGAYQALYAAQQEQDGGAKWGFAVEIAEQAAKF